VKTIAIVQDHGLVPLVVPATGLPVVQYECVLCCAVLDLPIDATPKVTIKAASGKPTWRVLSVDGKEIHRCERPSK
jgi:hypothetical protein